MTSIRGLLFDKDGTLFDFHATWRGHVDDLLARLTGDAALQALMGRAIGYDTATGRFTPGSPAVAGSTSEVVELLAALAPDHAAAEIERMANDSAIAANGDGLVPVVPDLRGLLAGLAEHHRMGVATHDSEAAAHAHLDSENALDLFGFVAGYDSGHGLKPGPGMLQAFCAATGLAAAEVAVMGDSLHDLHMARAGGAGLAIGVLTGPADASLLEPEADAVLGSIGELPEFLSLRAST